MRIALFLCIFAVLLLVPHGLAIDNNGSVVSTSDLIQENDIVLAQNPQNVTALMYRALIFYNDEKYPEAINVSDTILKVNQNNSFAWHIIGSSWGNLGDQNKAVEAFKKAADLSPGDPTEYNVQGVAYARVGKFNEAVSALEKATQINSTYAVAWNNLGVTYRNMNKTDLAIDAFKKAIALDPEQAAFYSNMGYAELDKKDYGAAAICASSAKKIQMTNVPQWFVAGDAYFAQGDYKNAFYSYDGGFTTMQKNDLWYYQGVKNSRITSKMEPVEAYYQSVASNVRFTGEWDRVTVIEYKIKRYQDTLDVYDQIITIEPDLAEGWRRKGYCALKLEMYESAYEAYKRAYELTPNNSDVLASLGYTIGKQGDYLNGMNSIDQAIKMDPNNGRAYLLKGEIHSMYGERKEAADAFNKALEKDPHNTDIFNALQEIDLKNGDYLGAAINFFRGAIGF